MIHHPPRALAMSRVHAYAGIPHGQAGQHGGTYATDTEHDMPALTRLFPLWAVLVSAGAIASPAPFLALTPAITPLLAFIMFTMGVTLSLIHISEPTRP